MSVGIQQRRANGGSSELLAVHFEAHRQTVFGFLRSRVRGPELAEDLLQQVFERLLRRADWGKIDNPEAYIRTTARHVLSDFYRHQGARDNGVVIDFEEYRHHDETWAPCRALESQQHLRRLAAILQALSPNVRKAFVMSRIFGYTYAEIGCALSISPRTVEKHVAKGMARCFESLSNEPDQ